MGRHKDPEIIELIQTLKRRGKSWGFIANDEFKVLNGLYWVDLVWNYREDHSLFITFEIEKKENDRLLKNLDKIFATPSSEVEKPYHHFLIVYEGQLSSGLRIIVNEKARAYNIHFFENLKSDSSEWSRLDAELKQLEIELPSLIRRRGKIDSASAVRDTLKGLEDVVPVLEIWNKPYPINQSTLTSSSMISVVPVPVSSGAAFDTKLYEGYAVVAIPKRRFRLNIPGTSAGFDVVLSKKEEDFAELRLLFEACELPYTLAFTIMKDKKGGGFHIGLDSEVADVVQVKKFEDFLRAYKEKEVLHVMNTEGKVIVGCEGISLKKPLSSDAWYQAISDLAFIQEMTSHTIACPKDLKISPMDLVTIYRITNIIQKGEEILPLKAITITLKKELVEKLVKIQEDSNKISKLSAHLEKYTANLLGEELELGPVVWALPDMVFREPTKEIAERIKDIEQNTLVELTMLPFSSPEVRIIYRRWAK